MQNKYLKQVSSWFNDLPERDRFIFIGGTVAVLVFLAYAVIWEPLAAKTESLKQSVSNQREDYQWILATVNEINEIRGSQTKAAVKDRGNQSLIGLADQTARDNGLSNSIQRIQPNASGGVQVWLKAATFDDVLNWLMNLEEYGVTVNTVKLRRQNEPGLVNLELVVKDS